MPARCIDCGNPIARQRIVAFLDAGRAIPDQCEECSTEQKAIGYGVFAHKTAPEVLIVPPNASQHTKHKAHNGHTRGPNRCTAG